ncbi:hypothetical protein GQ457_11G024960 [Hibiscus cannabinus]
MDFEFTSFPIILLLWVSFSFAQNVNVVIHGATSIAKTDDNSVCATLDWWLAEKCDYNQCSWGKAGILNLDLCYDSLINAVKAFNPLRIKVGGSLQDNVVYKEGEVKSCPGFFKKEDGLFGFSKGCLSMERWDQLNTFFNHNGVKLTFGLNALFGRNESQTEKGVWIGDWQPKNTRDFVKNTISKGYKVDSYEFGNQLCGSGIGARVDANQYGKDVIVLKNLVKEFYADPETRPRVLGPGCFYDEKWLNTFLEVSGRGVVDGVTHHIYNLGPGDDPNLMSKILDPLYLSQVSQTYKGVLNVVNKFRPQSGAWVSESGGAFNSGSKDVSPTFLDEFCALLWHRLMGSTVVAVTKESYPDLRVYAHCAKKKSYPFILRVAWDFFDFYQPVERSIVQYNPSNLKSKDDGKPNYDFFGIQNIEEYYLTLLFGKMNGGIVCLNDVPMVQPGARVDANQYGKDVIILKNFVKELYADPETRPKVLGPGCFYDEKWLNTFLEVLGQGVFDAFTHHIYNLGPGDDPNLMSKILNPLYLSQVSHTYKGVLNVVNKFRPQSGAWVSESGGAFNSGSIDVSPTIVDGFFALLWHRLMGSTVLAVTKKYDPDLRVYARCAKKKPGVSLFFINLSKDRSFYITLSNLKSEDDGKPNYEFVGKQNREECHLTSLFGKRKGGIMCLNDVPMVQPGSRDIPTMDPRLVDASTPIYVAAQSIAYCFDRHGVVVDAFISVKRGCDDVRFGFVRMVSKGDALRAIERLDGATMYESRVCVSFTIRDTRDLFWRRRRENPILDRPQGTGATDFGSAKPGEGRVEHRRRSVEGTVDDEKLSVLQTYAIGWVKEAGPIRVLAQEMEASGL